MPVLTGVLFGVSLFISLGVQSNLTPLAGAWLPFLLAACAIMLADKERLDRSLSWWCAVLWLTAITLSTFIVMPVMDGASSGWILAALPLIATTMKPRYLKSILTASACVVLTYAACLIAQVMFKVQYTHFSYPSHFGWNLPAWPLIDPNNAACVMLFGAVPFFWLAFGRRKWLAPFALCFAALLLTESKAGMLAFGLAALLIIGGRTGWWGILLAEIFTAALAIAAWIPYHKVILAHLHDSIAPRLTLWSDAWPMFFIHPWRGIGMGMFHIYYMFFRRHDMNTAGYYLHNDLYQMLLEMGVPLGLPMLVLIGSIAFTTCRRNLPAAATLLAVLIASCFEFQFYLQSVSLLAGVALGYHRLQRARFL